MRDVFTPADIMLPAGVSFEKWSVIACDQFSSQRDYWERVRGSVGSEPSTLNMIIPEAYLDQVDLNDEINKISRSMDDYLERGLMRRVEDSFVYVERTLTDGRVRRGLVGAVDLDEYVFSGFDAAILASEGTVLERLPVRIRVRKAVKLETPHIITFINDMDKTVIEPLKDIADSLPLLYDFDLMEGGGHIMGRRVSGRDAGMVMAAMRKLHEENGPLIVIGDGNHSLAAAKAYWDELKLGLGGDEVIRHPARRALVEVNNVYDPAISFEAIHRVVFGVEPGELLGALERELPPGGDYELHWVSGSGRGVIGVKAKRIGDMLSAVQAILDGFLPGYGGYIDYVHGEDAAAGLAMGDRRLGLLLPKMDKSELFDTVGAKGVFPKKSFSVGHARDKRYYLECRRIVSD